MIYRCMEEVHGIFYELQICELYPEYFLSATGLAQQGCLKKTEVDIELLTDVDVLLMVEKSIRVGNVHAIYHYGKANKKYMKDYGPNKESSYSCTGVSRTSMDERCHKRCQWLVSNEGETCLVR